MVKGPKTRRWDNIEVSHLQWCDDDARERRGKGFRGSSVNHHGNKQRKSGVTACTTVRQVRLQSPPVASSLAIRHWGGDGPLHSKLLVTKVEPLDTGGDTHKPLIPAQVCRTLKVELCTESANIGAVKN